MPKKTPPFKHYPKWTEARFFGFLRSALRTASRRWAPKYEVVEGAKRNKPSNKKGRHKFEYQCSGCKKWFKRTEVEVDHIVPTGSLRCFEDLPGFVERMFVGVDGMEVLCKGCHSVKTKRDRK